MSNSARIVAAGQMHEGTAWLVRRLAAVWVSAWVGMILLVVALTVVALTLAGLDDRLTAGSLHESGQAGG